MLCLVSPRQRLRATEPSTRSLKTVRLCGIRFAQFYRKATQFLVPVMVSVSWNALSTIGIRLCYTYRL